MAALIATMGPSGAPHAHEVPPVHLRVGAAGDTSVGPLGVVQFSTGRPNGTGLPPVAVESTPMNM